MGKCIYILFSIAGILSVPIILLLIWLLLAICSKFFEGIVTTLESFRKCRLKFVENAAEYKNNIAKYSKLNDEDFVKLKDGKTEVHKIIWSHIVSWTNVHYIATAFIASFIVAIIFLLLTLCVDGYVTDKERVVLAFVGVLATFVVLTNHAQSTERIKVLEKIIEDSEAKLNKTINDQKKTNLQILNERIDEITQRNNKNTLIFVQACQDVAAYNLATELYLAVHETPNKTYKIQSKQGENINATIEITKDLIKFSSVLEPYGMIPNNQIDMIDGKKYDYSKVRTIILALKQIDEKNNKQQKIL